MPRSARRKPIITTLNKALREIVQDQAVADKLASIETYLLPLDQATPEAHRAKLAAQIALLDADHREGRHPGRMKRKTARIAARRSCQLVGVRGFEPPAPSSRS